MSRSTDDNGDRDKRFNELTEEMNAHYEAEARHKFWMGLCLGLSLGIAIGVAGMTFADLLGQRMY